MLRKPKRNFGTLKILVVVALGLHFIVYVAKPIITNKKPIEPIKNNADE